MNAAESQRLAGPLRAEEGGAGGVEEVAAEPDLCWGALNLRLLLFTGSFPSSS